MMVYLISALVLLLVILGALLYLGAQFVIRRFMGQRASEKKMHLWIWRSFILVLLAYSVFVIAANKEFLAALFPGPAILVLILLLTIYFTALIEIIIIDVLLPDIIAMWKRIGIEMFLFLLLCWVSYYVFNLGLAMLSAAS